jgi:arylformamidase
MTELARLECPAARIHDLTLPLSAETVTWPGDPRVRVEARLRIADGHPVNVSELVLGSHTGTHVDPPFHFDDKGSRADELPLSLLMGPAWVCAVESEAQISVPDLEGRVPDDCNRLLLKTRNSDLWQRGKVEFTPDFVAPSGEAAHWMVEKGVRLLGLDYLSADRPDAEGFPAHRALLGAGVIIVEGLDLSSLTAGWYNLYCLPLKVAGGDGAPARAVAVGPLQ